MTSRNKSRRNFLKAAGAGALAAFAGNENSSAQQQAETAAPVKPKKQAKFRLGMASYTFREFGLEQTLAMTKRLGLENIALKSFHLPLESTDEQIADVAAAVRKAGLNLYGGGVIYMKTAEEVNRAFEYARLAGMKVIIGVPNHELLGMCEEKVKQYDIQIAIHNHGPGDELYPTPGSAYEKIKGMDKRMGLCLDVGHTQRSGIDPADAAVQYADRLIDVHIKDVSEAASKGSTVEIGRGVIAIPKLLGALIEIEYDGIASFEFEKDGKDPLAGVAESVGYVRGVLAVMN